MNATASPSSFLLAAGLGTTGRIRGFFAEKSAFVAEAIAAGQSSQAVNALVHAVKKIGIDGARRGLSSDMESSNAVLSALAKQLTAGYAPISSPEEFSTMVGLRDITEIVVAKVTHTGSGMGPIHKIEARAGELTLLVHVDREQDLGPKQTEIAKVLGDLVGNKVSIASPPKTERNAEWPRSFRI